MSFNGNNERDVTLDIAKGIGIVLVVIGHCIDGQGYGGRVIWAFHMPLFFFISGLLFRADKYNYREFINRKIRTLIVPCIFFSIISYAVSYVCDGKIDLLKLKEGFPVPMWFLGVLFLSELYFYTMIHICRNDRCLSFFILVNILIGMFLDKYEYLTEYSISSVFCATAFLAVGYLSKTPYKSIIGKMSASIILLLWVVVFFYAAIGQEHTSLVKNDMTLYGYIVAFCGIVGVLWGAKKMIRLPMCTLLFSYLGRNSIIIMCTHMFLIKISSSFFLFHPYLLYKIVEQIFIWICCLFFVQLFSKPKLKYIIGKS